MITRKRFCNMCQGRIDSSSLICPFCGTFIGKLPNTETLCAKVSEFIEYLENLQVQIEMSMARAYFASGRTELEDLYLLSQTAHEKLETLHDALSENEFDNVSQLRTLICDASQALRSLNRYIRECNRKHNYPNWGVLACRTLDRVGEVARKNNLTEKNDDLIAEMNRFLNCASNSADSLTFFQKADFFSSSKVNSAAPPSASLDLSPKSTELLDDVEFRIAAPKALKRGCNALVKFMMYSSHDFDRAERIAKFLSDQVAQNVDSGFELERGTKLRICLQSKDVTVEDESREMVWNGRFSSCDFTVCVPANFSGMQIALNARVYHGLAVLTDLKLILDATGISVSEPAQRCCLTSAFFSYSSNDRSRVIACMRGMLLAREDMDIFIDVIKLRRGEHWEQRIYQEIDRRDLFYLFWSRAAAQSEWVKKELDYALRTKGETAIEPVPLELPEICPPPSALNSRHFNDWMLLYELQNSATKFDV